MITQADIDSEQKVLKKENDAATEAAGKEVTRLIAKGDLTSALRTAHEKGIVSHIPENILRDAVVPFANNTRDERDLAIAFDVYTHLRDTAKADDVTSEISSLRRSLQETEYIEGLCRG